ncbi:MAG: hypothetical protein ABSE70_09235 [Candidatus Limnocylindrales bacterium]
MGGLVLAAVVLRQGGSSGPPATGGAPATATIAVAGTATPIASPEAPSPSLTIAATRGPVTFSSSPASGDGAVVFSDDFQNRSSGWPTASQSGFMTFSFTSKGYVINAGGGVLHHLVYSPSKQASQQLSISLTAGLASASTGAGLGVTCRRGQGASEISYELLVQNDGGWLVTRRDGAPSLGALATTLSHGSSAVVPGTTPITVVGMCATLGDGTATRLVLFVEGKKVADMVDSATLPAGGWMGGLLVASRDTPAVATATRYEERDLTK